MKNIFWSSVMRPPQLLALSSEYEKAKRKSNSAAHWVIVQGDMASQRARCRQISSFVAFAIHVNGEKDKSLRESAQFCRAVRAHTGQFLLPFDMSAQRNVGPNLEYSIFYIRLRKPLQAAPFSGQGPHPEPGWCPAGKTGQSRGAGPG